MKKIVKFCLLLLVFNLNINVFATNDNSSLENDNLKEEVPVTGEKSQIATLDEVYINEEKVVCDDNLVCEKLIQDNSIDEATISYKKTDSKSTVSPSGEKIVKELQEGINEVKLEVTAEDGITKKEYTIKITKELLSTDSTLKKLVINGEEIELEKDVVKYQTTVSYSTKELEVEAIPNDTEAKVQDAKNNKISYDFFENEKEIKIKVEAKAGDLTTYVIKVSKREEADATLKSLKITDVDLDFESEKYDYEVTVLKNVDKLKIDAVASDEDSLIKIDNPDSIQIGENTVKIEVSNDGNINTYTIKVTKLDEENNSLANLSSLKIDNYELEFKEDKYEYDLKIGDVNFLVIDAVPKFETSEVEITGNLDLVNGSIIKIKVIYDEETENIYKINIKKDENIAKENNSLIKIVIIVIISFVLVAIIVLVIILIIRKKKNKNKKNDVKVLENQNVENKDVISLIGDTEIEDII